MDRSVLAWREVTDRQYMVSGSEDEAAKTLMADPRMKAALARRGLTDPSVVNCSPQNHGYFDLPEELGKRLSRFTCMDTREAARRPLFDRA